MIKSLPANAGEVGLRPRTGRLPGREHSNPLKYSCPENPMKRGVLWATIYGVKKSQIWLSISAELQNRNVTTNEVNVSCRSNTPSWGLYDSLVSQWDHSDCRFQVTCSRDGWLFLYIPDNLSHALGCTTGGDTCRGERDGRIREEDASVLWSWCAKRHERKMLVVGFHHILRKEKVSW